MKEACMNQPRHAALLLLVLILGSLVPTSWYGATPTAKALTPLAAPPTPVRKTVQSVTYPQLPGLALSLAVAPTAVAVGDTATITVVVTNRAPHAANDIVIELPLPHGVVALPDPARVSATAGWRWTASRLASGERLEVSAAVRVAQRPTTGALLARASVMAHGLTEPVTAGGGALVRDPNAGPTTTTFVPGTPAVLRSRDGQVEVRLPAKAAAHDLTLTHGASPTAKLPPLPGHAPGFGAFSLTATDQRGQDVHQFAAPLTIAVQYTPEQVQALGIQEDNLQLFWFDEQRRAWVVVPTRVDRATHTALATVDHFSTFNLSDGSSPSAAYIPSLQGFQVGLYTGAASKTIPMEVPAGPNGLKPTLDLSYSSAATDGPGGTRQHSQAGWVGKGWSFDPGGAVARNKSTGSSDQHWDHFTLVFGGRSFDVARGAPKDGSYTNYDIANWTWHTVDENFTRVEVQNVSGSYRWSAWTKDGTRYEFQQALAQRLYHTGAREEYKWLLTRVVDTHGNVINYAYHLGIEVDSSENLHPTYHLKTIEWGYDGTTPSTGTARYRVEFDVSSRWASPTESVDLKWEYPGYPTANARWEKITPHEAYRLNKVNVFSQPAGAISPLLVRQYVLSYAPPRRVCKPM